MKNASFLHDFYQDDEEKKCPWCNGQIKDSGSYYYSSIDDKRLCSSDCEYEYDDELIYLMKEEKIRIEESCRSFR